MCSLGLDSVTATLLNRQLTQDLLQPSIQLVVPKVVQRIVQIGRQRPCGPSSPIDAFLHITFREVSSAKKADVATRSGIRISGISLATPIEILSGDGEPRHAEPRRNACPHSEQTVLTSHKGRSPTLSVRLGPAAILVR